MEGCHEYDVRVKWPDGYVIIFKIPGNLKVEDLIRVLKEISKVNGKLDLIFRGSMMNRKSVISQYYLDKSTSENDVIETVIDSFGEVKRRVDISSWIKTQEKIREVYYESLKINDRKFEVLEGQGSSSAFFNEIFYNMEQNEENSEKYRARSPEYSIDDINNTSTGSLPLFWNENETKRVPNSFMRENLQLTHLLPSLEEVSDHAPDQEDKDWSW